MTIKEIVNCRNNYGVGDKVKCSKFTNGDKFQQVTAKIIAKYPYFALVSDGITRWCVNWVDLVNCGR
jgi:hypothetical protein